MTGRIGGDQRTKTVFVVRRSRGGVLVVAGMWVLTIAYGVGLWVTMVLHRSTAFAFGLLFVFALAIAVHSTWRLLSGALDGLVGVQVDDADVDLESD